MSDIKTYVEGLLANARAAQKEFEKKYTTQAEVDKVVRVIAKVCFDHKEELAADAVAETGMGTVEYKITKIIGTTIKQWNEVKGKKAMGFIDNPHVDEPGVRVIAKPIGVVGVVCPVTNPVITPVCNCMQAVKCRNAAIVAPHPKAKNVSNKLIKMIQAEFKAMGAPENLVQIIEPDYISLEATDILLSSTNVNVATGGPGMVKAVYKSGVPSFGVGQGNTQEIVCDDWEDYASMVPKIIANRAWDLGVPCTGDQMVHIPKAKEDAFLAEMEKNGAYVVKDPADVQKLRDVIFPGGGKINTKVVGQTPATVGKMAGLDVPEDASILLTKIQAQAEDDVLCKEVLFPFSRYRTYDTLEEAVDVAVANLEMEGAGHSSSIWSNNNDYIEYAAMRIPVSRFHVNQVPLGAGNGLPHTSSFSCGFWGGNNVSENFQWYHLYQTTRITTPVPGLPPISPADFDDYDVLVKTPK